jgi:hypothetical protein
MSEKNLEVSEINTVSQDMDATYKRLLGDVEKNIDFDAHQILFFGNTIDAKVIEAIDTEIRKMRSAAQESVDGIFNSMNTMNIIALKKYINDAMPKVVECSKDADARFMPLDKSNAQQIQHINGRIILNRLYTTFHTSLSESYNTKSDLM